MDYLTRQQTPVPHPSLERPTPQGAPEAFAEMQKQMASFIATRGTTVVVENAATMVPVIQAGTQAAPDLQEKSDSKAAKGRKAVKRPGKLKPVSRLESGRTPNRLNNFD